MSDTNGAAGAAGAGAGDAGAAGTAGAAGAAGAGAAGAAGAGAGSGAAAAGGGAGGQQQDAPWYAKPEMKLSDTAGLFAKGHNFTDINAALEYAAQAETMFRSRNVMEKPDPAKPLEWKGWTELGWKEKAEEYQIETPKDFQANAIMLEGFKKLAHENRVPLPVAQGLYNGMAEMITKQIGEAKAAAETARAQAAKEAGDALRAEWGGNFDANLEMAKRAARTPALGLTKEVADSLERALAGPDGKGGAPALLKFFHTLGSKMSEAQLVGDEAGGGRTAATPQEARLERLALENNPEWMAIFKNNRHPQHQDYVQQRQALLKIEASKAA